MYIKILVFIGVIFCYDLTRGLLESYRIKLSYKKLIVNKNDNNNEYSPFCVSINTASLIYLCERSFESLRKQKLYEEMYFDYESYQERDNECRSVTVLLDNDAKIIQQVAVCRGRSAIIENNIATQKNDITGVKIFALSLNNVFIFDSSMNKEEDLHVLVNWLYDPDPSFSVDPPEKKTYFIPEILFQKHLPTSSSNAKYWYLEYFQEPKISKKSHVSKNSQTPYSVTFAQLCTLAIRRSKYFDVMCVNVNSLRTNELITKDVNVIIEGDVQIKNINMKLGFCNVYKKKARLVATDLQVYKDVRDKNNVEFYEEIKNLIKDTYKSYSEEFGYEIPQEKLEVVLEFMKKYNLSQNGWTVLFEAVQSPTEYALSNGPHENSMMVIKEVKDNDMVQYKAVELIQNVHAEFVKKIDLGVEENYLNNPPMYRKYDSKFGAHKTSFKTSAFLKIYDILNDLFFSNVENEVNS